MVNDIEGIFADSNAEEVFSEEGIKILSQFKYWETYIFYIYVGKSVLIIIFIA